MTSLRAELTQLRELAVTTGFVAGWSALKAVPEPLSARAFRWSADAATARNGPAVRQLRKNLGRVLGSTSSGADLENLVGKAMRSYARHWLETFRWPRMDRAQLILDIDANTIGADHLDAAVDTGRGFVIALPHTGNWDIAGFWLFQRSGRGFTRAR